MSEPNDPTPLRQKIRLDSREIAGRLVFLGFVQQDADVLVSLRSWVQHVADDFLERFYDEQFSHAEFAEIVNRAGSDRQRLQAFQRRYLLELFTGMPDAAYVESRLQIGALHARIGVTPRWYVSSYGLYEKYLFPLLRRHFLFRPGKAKRAIAALGKLLNFDKALVLDMYIEGLTDEARGSTIDVNLDSKSQARELLNAIEGGTFSKANPNN